MSIYSHEREIIMPNIPDSLRAGTDNSQNAGMSCLDVMEKVRGYSCEIE